MATNADMLGASFGYAAPDLPRPAACQIAALGATIGARPVERRWRARAMAVRAIDVLRPTFPARRRL